MSGENKRFNDRVKVILSRKVIKGSGQKRKYVNVMINGVNIKLQLNIDLLIF